MWKLPLALLFAAVASVAATITIDMVADANRAVTAASGCNAGSPYQSTSVGFLGYAKLSARRSSGTGCLKATLDNGLSLSVSEGSRGEVMFSVRTDHLSQSSGYLPVGTHQLEVRGVSMTGGGTFSAYSWINYTDGFMTQRPMRLIGDTLQSEFEIYPGQPAWGRRGGVVSVWIDFYLDNTVTGPGPATTATPEPSSLALCLLSAFSCRLLFRTRLWRRQLRDHRGPEVQPRT